VQVEHGAAPSKAVVVAAKVHALDEHVSKRAGAHDAGFAGDIQRGIRQDVLCRVAVLGSDGLNRHDLGMHGSLQYDKSDPYSPLRAN
jgi:hypothetical protein